MSMEEETTSQLSDSAGNEESAEANRRGIEAVYVMVKRRRGRPRKNSADSEDLVSVSSPQVKRGRGRPRGSGRLQFLASLGKIAAETARESFTPHVLNVQIGEDIISKVLLFSLRDPGAVCILSASGAVSMVVIRQPGFPSSILEYEGWFKILTLSGSCLFGDKEEKDWKRGDLTVSLAKPNGSVFGGEIAGLMIAAAPVQLILGSFKINRNCLGILNDGKLQETWWKEREGDTDTWRWTGVAWWWSYKYWHEVRRNTSF